MNTYDHTALEKKWQNTWEADKLYGVSEDTTKKKCYVLDMFPYPSGAGLHVGHPKGYIATDVYARYKRMQGYSVLHPMGWDAFGLPAENYALKNKVHPSVAVQENVARFKEQLKKIGFDYDWEREINTTDPAFYKWTQWAFVQMFKKGLAYESYEPINWCPGCKTGLANEDLDGDRCERCDSLIEKKPVRQWVLRITDYADRLLADLDALPWAEHVKEAQRNWIGKSNGALIRFQISADSLQKDESEFKGQNEKGKSAGKKAKFVLLHGYTGRADKNFIPWLKKELERQGFDVQAPQLPNTDTPVEEDQVSYVLEHCTIDTNTILVGHSLGGVVAMKVVEKLPHAVAGLVLVAPAVEPAFRTGEPRNFWDTFDIAYDYNTITSKTGFRIVLSDTLENEYRGAYLAHLAKNIGAQLLEATAKRTHFCANAEPFILESIFDELSKRDSCRNASGLLRTACNDDVAMAGTETCKLQPASFVEVFTTRPDTLYGATYVVLAPEHPLVQELLENDSITNAEGVRAYINDTGKKTEIDRTAEGKEKTGVRLEGVVAINPANSEEVPIYIADYVLAGYGTGAIMAVPAHDERDFAFAKKYGLPIRQVVVPCANDSHNPPQEGMREVVRDTAIVHLKDRATGKYALLRWHGSLEGITTAIMGGIEMGQTPEEAALAEIAEEAGLTGVTITHTLQWVTAARYCASHKGENRCAIAHAFLAEIESTEGQADITEHEQALHTLVWVDEDTVLEQLTPDHQKQVWQLLHKETPCTDSGILMHSGPFTSMSSEEAKTKITEHAGGKMTTQYRLQDWVFSRQRYWGEPIPIIHCEKCGAVPVPEQDLPVQLPDVESYEPTGTGESPLAGIAEWVNTTCPACGGAGKRETNTMPQWAGSSWYYLRYLDPTNDTALVDATKEKYWSPVDVYVGGMEHATRHLIYARFWHKFLYDIGVVHDPEPFQKLYTVGIILAEDGRKMSKRWGNVINPDDMVARMGADALRVYEMFMGPFGQSIAWSTDHMVGARRFLERVWNMREKVESRKKKEESIATTPTTTYNLQPTTSLVLHQTIKKVSEDIETFSFNTAVSQMMVLVNALEKLESVPQHAYETLVRILAPFAPHLTEELWESLGHTTSIHLEPWPVHDESVIASAHVTIAVQINGKVRDTFTTAPDTPKDALLMTAKSLPKITEWLNGKEVVREVVVPGRLVNIVIA